MIDVSKELQFKTARSSGSGGQNVNKVETMVEAYFQIETSALLTDEQKNLIHQKLPNRINSNGVLYVKNQTKRTQLANKELAIKKMNLLIKQAIHQPKKRKQTKPSAATKEMRIVSKKRKGETKSNRKKINPAADF